jgi:molybdenum cofactor cytidylyltransferase
MDLQPNDLTAGIILAAGSASRMGPKLLLPWKGETLIRHAARTALSCLKKVVVVTGAQADDIQQALAGLSVQIVHNPEWADGQSTSVRAGIRALPANVSSALFLLGDQPYVSTELIQSMVTAYAQMHPLILAPYVGGKRSNPVLFDRSIFETLCQLQGDAGARTIFAQYPPTPFDWPDEYLLFDVDTPEDYQRLLEDV